MQLTPEDRVMILAPIVRGRKGEFKKELEKLAQAWFHPRAHRRRAVESGRRSDQLDKRKNHTIEVVVDRLLVKPGIEKRLETPLALAMKLAEGLVQVAVVGGEEQLYSAHWPARIAASTSRSSSRVRFLSTTSTALARNAMGWATNMILIPPRSLSTGRSRCSMAHWAGLRLRSNLHHMLEFGRSATDST